MFVVVWNITDRQLAQLVERGKGWPWNGYQLIQMKRAGSYPPSREKSRSIGLRSIPRGMLLKNHYFLAK